MADDAAPFRPSPGGRKDSKPRGTSTKGGKPKRDLIPVEQLRDTLKGFVTKLGMVVYARDKVDGTVIIGSAPELVDAYCDLAKNNIYVHRVLDSLGRLDSSAGILTATAAPALAIAAHHGMYRGPLLVSIEEYERRALDQNPDMGFDEEYDEDDDSDLDSPPSD